MRRDYQISLLCAASAIPCGIALMVAPSYFHFQNYIAVYFWSGLALTLILFGAALVIAWYDSTVVWQLNRRRKMLGLIGMIASGIMFVGFSTFYFLVEKSSPPAQDNSEIDAFSASNTEKGLDYTVTAKCEASKLPVTNRDNKTLYFIPIGGPPRNLEEKKIFAGGISFFAPNVRDLKWGDELSNDTYQCKIKKLRQISHFRCTNRP